MKARVYATRKFHDENLERERQRGNVANVGEDKTIRGNDSKKIVSFDEVGCGGPTKEPTIRKEKTRTNLEGCYLLFKLLLLKTYLETLMSRKMVVT